MRVPLPSPRNAGLSLLVGAFLGALFTGDSRVAAVLLALAGVGWVWCARSHSENARRPVLFWSVALGLRLAAFVCGPVFSDDVQRYAWEGEVLLAGKSPYAYAPNAPELSELRARSPELAARVNHPDVPAVYPPLTQACGLAAAAVVHAAGAAPGSANVWILRSVFLLGDLGVLFVLLRARHSGRLSAAAPVIWGWCPLVCLEFAGSGHLDSLGILCLLLGLLALESGSGRAAVWSGLGAAIKFLPLCLLPWIGRGSTPRRRMLLVAGALGLLALSYLPFLFLEGSERGLGSGLREYGERWESGSLVYRWVVPRLGSESTRVLLGLAWLGCSTAFVLRRRDAWSGAGAILGTFLVLSPTLHPWYVLWMLPFLAHRPSLAWSWLVASIPLSYWPLDAWKEHGRWIDPAWIWWVIAPMFAVLWIGGRRAEVRA